MLRRAIVPVIALLLVPAGSAEWRAAGGLEPDTVYDMQGGMMFEDGDAGTDDAIRQVHFQAFVAAPETSFNPNVALVGSSVVPAPALHHRALLGVWKDCNGDGYIGNAESALMDYSSALLLFDTATCPAVLGATFPVHNDGAFVSELLAIGMVDPCEYELEVSVREACGVTAYAPNERVIYVNDTFVWGDLGAPGSVPKTECILAPLPSGTTSGTGAVLAWSDCQSRRGVARTVNEVDEDGSLGLRFEDTSRPQDSSSPLNQRFPVTPFGHAGEPGLLQKDTSESSARTWDCNAASTDVNDPDGYREIAITDPTGRLHAERFPLVIPYTLTGIGFEDEDRDPSTPGVFRQALTDEEGTYARLPSLDPRLNDPTASWWVALEAAIDGPAGDCDPATDSAIAPAYFGGSIESDATPILEARKDRTSLTFKFYDGHRGFGPELDPYTGPTTPSDGGTMVLDHGGTVRGGDGPLWSALSQSEQDPQLVDREDLGFSGPLYFTYYVHLGLAARAFTLPNDDAHTYGSDNCGEADSGLHKGWICDPALWWRDANGNSNVPTFAQGARLGRVPGDTYHMRDVDCYDGELVNGTSVYASLVYLDEACG